MNLDFVHDCDERPTPLSFKRNGDNINDKHDRMVVPDEDKGGKYFGASLRMGPFMTVQEDRVSKNLLLVYNLIFFNIVHFQRKIPGLRYKRVLCSF